VVCPGPKEEAQVEDWQSRWKDKVTDVQTAIAAIPRGRRILVGSGAAVPQRLVRGLADEGRHLADNQVVHLLTLGEAPYVAPGLEGRLRHTAFFIGPNVRDAVHEGRADFMPVFLSEIPSLIRSRRLRIDVALIQVCPPDRHGYVSLGVSVDVVRAAVDAADLVIAEVNPNMPRTLGDAFVHVDAIAHLIPVDDPLLERPFESPDETAAAIGRHVAELVPNGATLQTGIGKIPNAVMDALGHHEDLGVHTEMISDGVMRLAEAGIITGRRKSLLPGKIVTSFVMGTRKLYEWIDDNPVVEMRPSEFTNDPLNIARNDRMVAVNSALAVDLTGQVAADTLLGRFFSGIGGQVDFIRGAARSRGGRPIIALPATAKGGTVSRIRPVLEEGAGVVTSRGDVHYVVTEFGVADLWGKNIRERALSLIEIAHPKFRDELLEAAKERRYVFASQLSPRATLPWEEASSATLSTGEAVRLRPARMSDAEDLQDLFYRLSDESTRRRFLAHKTHHPRDEMASLVDLDYERNMALVVTLATDGEALLGMSRYDVDPATDLADIAFVVREEWQGRGIGTMLMHRMYEIARARGLAGFTARVSAENRDMLGIFSRSGLELEAEPEDGVYRIVARLPAPRERPPE
jgi:acyl-CoA hydrolase/GNAT superfamily N-acetyltransferase